MVEVSINIDALWDADAYHRAGNCPWTIFAYPASLADGQRLPRDDEASRFLFELLKLDLSIGLWTHPEATDTIYFACPFDERDRIQAVITDLEQRGTFAPGFPAQHCEYLFSLVPPST